MASPANRHAPHADHADRRRHARAGSVHNRRPEQRRSVSREPSPLGKPTHRLTRAGWTEVRACPLADDTIAAGLLNRGISAAPVTAKWPDLGKSDKQPIRDLWQQKDLPPASDTLSLTVPRHGAVLIRIGQPKATPPATKSAND